jgi:uroporphyrinogen-III synthase
VSARDAASARLAGRRVVIARAEHQAGRLAALLAAEGAEVVSVPTVQVIPPADGGAALAAALDRLASYDWVVLTSPNGVAAFARALDGRPWPPGTRLAVIGPGTAEAARASGFPVHLVASRSVAEGLLAEFPSPPARVLVAQQAGARTVLAEGLRAAGHAVDAVPAYAVAPLTPAPAVLAAARDADAVAFTSGSIVRSYVAAAGTGAVPPLVVCIGPVTAEAAEAAGLPVAATAAEHTLEGLVEAVVGVLAGGSDGP